MTDTHSAGVADGVEGFVDFFKPFVERSKSRDTQVVRGFVDGQYAFVHVYQDINNGEEKWVTADIFDTDENDKIIEHWNVIQAYEEKTVSGRTMVDGPTEIEDIDDTVKNKAVVQNFFDDVLIGGDFNKLTSYISTEQYETNTIHM